MFHWKCFQEKEKEGQERLAALQQELTALQEKITLLSDEHQRELQTVEQKLEEAFKKRLAEKEVAYQEEIDALSKEWNTERQVNYMAAISGFYCPFSLNTLETDSEGDFYFCQN